MAAPNHSERESSLEHATIGYTLFPFSESHPRPIKQKIQRDCSIHILTGGYYRTRESMVLYLSIQCRYAYLNHHVIIVDGAKRSQLFSLVQLFSSEQKT